MTIERWFEMPRKWTFQQPKLRKWVEDRLVGNVLNMFGGVVRLTTPSSCLHNDISADVIAESRRNAYDLTQWQDLQGAFDTVVFDPPYSAHQCVVSYGGVRQQEVSHARDVVEYVLRPGGTVISLGWNSTGMSDSRNFRKDALALVNHGGSHNDTIVLSERRLP